MNEIKCPNCSTMFQINEEDYDSIVKQVRDKEFEETIPIRKEEMSEELLRDECLKLYEEYKNITDKTSY